MSNFNATLSALLKAESIKQLSAHLTQYLTETGIPTHSFTYYSYHPKSTQQLKYEYCSDSFLPWHQHYLSQNYNDIDSTLHNIYQSTLPTYWTMADQLKNSKTQREQQMRLDSVKFGTTAGLSIPVHGPNDEFASLTLIQKDKETWTNNRIHIQNDLLVLTHHYCEALRKLLLKEMEIDVNTGLSRRETQCLTLTAQRYCVDDIAKSLNITARTVNFHLQNINKKLGAKNKHESVNKALSKAWIQV